MQTGQTLPSGVTPNPFTGVLSITASAAFASTDIPYLVIVGTQTILKTIKIEAINICNDWWGTTPVSLPNNAYGHRQIDTNSAKSVVIEMTELITQEGTHEC